MRDDFYFRRHPVLANIIIILLIGIIGLFIAYLSLGLFTHHGEWDTVPEVEHMSYTDAINKLQSNGFRAEIRDSVYNETVIPGFVVEQFPKPGSKAKPNRKVFLYINALHPRELVIDSDNSSNGEALKGYSLRQGLAKLEELGFSKVNVIKVPGSTDRIIRIMANGRTISKMEKVPVTSLITVEVEDGSNNMMFDSLYPLEFENFTTEVEDDYYSDEDYDDGDYIHSGDDEIPEDEEPVYVQ